VKAAKGFRVTLAALIVLVVPLRSAQAQTASDSLALADAVAAVLIESEVGVWPLPPETPNPWETLLLERLWEANLPVPYHRFHWLQLRASRFAISDGTAEVSVHVRTCVSGQDGHADLGVEVRIHSFEKTPDGWEPVESRMDLTGLGTCDPAAPGPEAQTDLEWVLPAIDDVVRQAILVQAGKQIPGPMYLDVESLETAAVRGGVPLDEQAATIVWGGLTSAKRDAIEGDYKDWEEHGELQGEARGMWIKGDGILIEIDGLKEVLGGYDLQLSYSYTSDHKFRGLPKLGCAVMRLEFRYSEPDSLHLADSVTLAVC